MNKQFLCDLHIHSKYSNDSLLSPATIIKRAISKGFQAIAITDHNTIKGSAHARSLKPKSLLVISGAEITTEYGDLTGLFLHEEIQSLIFEEVIDEIHDQDGLVILPHPYRRKRFPPIELLSRVDLIEGINARTPETDNANAQNLARQLQKPMIAGSDAHMLFEIGNAWTDLGNLENPDEDILRKTLVNGGSQIFQVKPLQSRRLNQLYSYAIKRLKKT